MEQVLILWGGRHDREPWRSLVDHYLQRTGRTWKVEQRMVRVRAREDHRRIEEEGKAMLQAVRPSSLLVVLDAGGRQFTSETFAAKLADWFETRPGGVTFVIGSDLGVSRELRKAADLILSLGSGTLPHELARLVLVEQLYRALAIRTGIKYHREPP